MSRKILRLNFFNWFAGRPRTTGCLVCAILIFATIALAFQRYSMTRDSQIREMYTMLDVAHTNLEQSLKNCYTGTLSMALTVNDKGLPENFETAAARIMKSHPVLHSLHLAPDGVITYIYPPQSKTHVRGVNLLTDSARGPESRLSVRKQKMFFSGPYQLHQGGTGIIARFPIFREGSFWGFSSAVMRLDTLFTHAGMHHIDTEKYFFQLSKADSEKPQYFMADQPDLSGKLSVSKLLPDGNWELHLVAKDSNAYFWAILPILAFGTVLSLLLGALVAMLMEKPAESLKRSEARFESLFNDVPISLWLEDFSKVKTYLKTLDIHKKNEEELRAYFRAHPETVKDAVNQIRVIDINNECLKLHYPKTKNEVLAAGIEALCDPGCKSSLIEQLVTVTMGNTKFETDIVHTRSDAEIVELYMQWSVVKGYEDSLSRVIVSMEDITERKRAENMMRESKLRVITMLNSLDGMVWETDFVLDRNTFVSEKVLDITGFTSEEWLSEKNIWTNHLHPEDREATLDAYNTQILESTQFNLEYRFVRKDKKVIWIKDYINVVMHQGRPTHLRGIMIDVTKSREADRNLSESLQLVTEQNKRLQNFSYIVSHNLRSHTSNIQSIAALIETANTEEERAHLVSLLKTVSASLNETMTNLNDVVHIQTKLSLVRENLNVREYLKNTLTVLAKEIARRKAEVITQVPPEAYIGFNPAYFESILLNLVSNALRYSKPGVPPVIRIIWEVRDGVQTLVVSDNGIGMDMNKVGKDLFGMYKTFSSNPESKGIGLFITKNQIDAMGGKIDVQSQPGEGTTFTVSFHS